MIEEIYDGGPVSATLIAKNGDSITPEGGLSIRDWFAGMALQGLLAHVIGVEGANGRASKYAERSYQYADAMLEARKGVQP